MFSYNRHPPSSVALPFISSSTLAADPLNLPCHGLDLPSSFFHPHICHQQYPNLTGWGQRILQTNKQKHESYSLTLPDKVSSKRNWNNKKVVVEVWEWMRACAQAHTQTRTAHAHSKHIQSTHNHATTTTARRITGGRQGEVIFHLSLCSPRSSFIQDGRRRPRNRQISSSDKTKQPNHRGVTHGYRETAHSHWHGERHHEWCV